MTRRSARFVLTLAVLTQLTHAGCSSRAASSVDVGRDRGVAADTSVDANTDAGLTRDATRDRGAQPDIDPASFPAVLEGVWLVGWSGGMNHYSWVRFSRMSTPTMTRKDAWLLDGKGLVSNLPLWSCSGKASYWMGAAGNTIYLEFPSTTCLPGGSTSMGYVFSDFAAPSSGTVPKAAILRATIKDQPTLRPFEGYKFPDSWCDKAMTSCKAPF